ncbi:MAG: protein kinase [Planctomycetes bacterium]|nr:protein kinase [Planctomycetota bacterium]
MAGNSDTSAPTQLNLASGFLDLDSMASMHRVGESGAVFIEGGSTLLHVEGAHDSEAKRAASAAREELSHGHHVSDRYKVINEIARGGMGAVLEVHDSDLDRRVAMKVLLRDTRQRQTPTGSPLDTGPVDRFIAEAQLTGSLEHPNIVPVHELGLDTQGRVYFTMKRVKGRSLRRVLDKMRQGDADTLKEFNVARMLGVVLKICDALAFAHSKGIIHRDLKPENIMVGEFGEVLVMDWGLAKQIGPNVSVSGDTTAVLPKNDTRQIKLEVSLGAGDSDTGKTRDGTVSGTPAYMAPEQARGEVRELDLRTDVFCLGGILYETLCLVPPFLASKMTGALELARGHRLLAPKAKLAEVLANDELKRAFAGAGIERGKTHARELVAIAMKAMAERKQDRYPTIVEFRRDIEYYLSALPVTAYRDRFAGRVQKWMRRNPTRSAVMALFVVMLMAGGLIAAVASARQAEEERGLLEKAQSADKQRADAAAAALASEEKARKEAERRETLEREAGERNKREAAAMAARQAAFVPYSEAADLRARSATFTDWNRRADVWLEAASRYRTALEKDPLFVQAHFELGSVYADLGFDEDALFHFAEADRLTAAETGRGHVEALLAYAMYDFQRRLLQGTLEFDVREVLRRFEPVKNAAEKGSYFARLSEILLTLSEALTGGTGLDFRKAIDRAGPRLRELEAKHAPMWEIYALIAFFESQFGRDASSAAGYLEKARALKPNLPLLTWLDVAAVRRGRSAATYLAEGLKAWDGYVKQFPRDPRGYLARARIRYEADSDDATDLAVNDLAEAIANYPRYQDAHKLLLAMLARQGNVSEAREHLASMRRAEAGLGMDQVDAIEIELLTRVGDFERVENLVLDLLEEGGSVANMAMGQAGAVLILDNDFAELLRLCNLAYDRLKPAPPPIVQLFKARALMMLTKFVEAQALFKNLEANPQLLPATWRDECLLWADQARRFPALIDSNNRPPEPDCLDIGRILVTAGADPWRVLPLLDTTGRPQLGRGVMPADWMLIAILEEQMARRTDESMVRTRRDRAVDSLLRAFREGYLNRSRVQSNEFLAPLVTDERLSRYIQVR